MVTLPRAPSVVNVGGTGVAALHEPEQVAGSPLPLLELEPELELELEPELELELEPELELELEPELELELELPPPLPPPQAPIAIETAADSVRISVCDRDFELELNGSFMVIDGNMCMPDASAALYQRLRH